MSRIAAASSRCKCGPADYAFRLDLSDREASVCSSAADDEAAAVGVRLMVLGSAALFAGAVEIEAEAKRGQDLLARGGEVRLSPAQARALQPRRWSLPARVTLEAAE